ncbi:MAG: hypothetical protein KAS67_02055 [Thermoplasmata archaeon]|nr:hypothetical protein [Thermoplasmata archaeon]
MSKGLYLCGFISWCILRDRLGVIWFGTDG